MDEERRFAQPLLVFGEHHRVGRELLAERHRHRVLELGAAHLEHVGELRRLRLERLAQLRHRAGQALDAEVQRHLDRRRIHVVRALAHVHVLERVQVLVLAFRVAHELERAIGDHLVRVHVGRGARAALDHVDDELLEQRAVADLHRTPAAIASRLVVVEQPELVVRERRRLLDARERHDEVGIDRDRRAGDRKVLERAQRVHAVIGARGNAALAEQVVLAAIRSGWHRCFSVDRMPRSGHASILRRAGAANRSLSAAAARCDARAVLDNARAFR